MTWQWTPYLIPLVATGIALILAAIYTLRNHRTPGTKTVALVMLATAQWTLSYALELGSADLQTKILWTKTQYLGIVIVPTAWFVYTLQFTGRQRWLTHRNLLLLGVLPLITLVLAWTNEAHGLVWRQITLDTEASLPTLLQTYGTGLWLYIAYAYTLLLIGSLLLLQMFVRSLHLYRRQTFALLIGVFAPWIGNVVDMAGLTPVDVAPLAFSVTAFSMIWSLFRLRWGDIVPVAHTAILQSIGDGVIVLDAKNRVVELNAAAEELIDQRAAEATGRPVEQVWSHWPSLPAGAQSEIWQEIRFDRAGHPQTYDLRISPIVDWRDRIVSQVVVLRDISEEKRAQQALRESEERYRNLFRNAGDAIFLMRQDRFVDCNPATETMFDCAREEILGSTPYKFSPARQSDGRDSRRKAREKVAAALAGEPQFFEWIHCKLDGTPFHTEVKLNRIQLGGEWMLLAVVRDITQRKQAEAEIRQQVETLTALHDTALDLSVQRDLTDLLRAIVTRAVHLSRARGGGIYLYRPATDDLELVISQDLASDLTGDILQRGEGLSGKVLETGRSMAVDDYAAWEGRAAQHEGSDFTACAAVPIRWGTRLLGVLSIVTDLPHTFSARDIALLERFTPMAAAAMEQARLLQEAQAQWQQTETLRQASAAIAQTLDLDETLQRILKELDRVLPHDSGSIHLLRQGYTEIVSGRGFADPEAVIGLKFPVPGDNPNTRVIQDREPVILTHAQSEHAPFRDKPHDHIRSWLGVPLIVHDRVIGMLSVDSVESDRFGQRHVELVQPFAQYAATAIENARLYQAEQARHRVANTLHEVTQIIGSTLELDEVLHRILEELEKVLDFQTAALLLIDPARNELYVREWRGYPADMEKLRFPLQSEEGVTVHVAKTGRPTYVPDTTQDERYVDGGRAGRSELTVPLVVKGQVIGVLNAENVEPNAYTQEDLQLLAAFANQATIAIENARLYQEAQQQAQELARSNAFITALSRVAIRIQTTHERAKILETLGLELRGIGIHSFVMLLDPKDGSLILDYVSFGASAQKALKRLTGHRLQGYRVPAHRFATYETVVEGKEAIFLADTTPWLTSALPDFSEPQIQRILETLGVTPDSGVIQLPLMTEEKVMGILGMWGESLRQADVPTASAFAGQVAVALENARLVADLEEKVRARTAEILIEQERSEAILSSVNDAIGTTGLDMRIQYVNDAFTRLTGYTAEEAMGRMGTFLLAKRLPEQDWQALQTALVEGKVWQGEATFRRKNGRTYDAAITITPLRDAEGNLTGYVASHDDVSRAKELERARNQFMTNVSHELRTPVANLRLYAQLMRVKHEPEKVKKYIDVIQDQTIRLIDLVQDILEMTSMDSGKILFSWTRVDLATLLNGLLVRFQERAERKGLALRLRPVPADLPPLKGDPARLDEALSELVENAIIFTPAGGQVVLEAGWRESEGVDWITIAVRDTGPGILAEEQERVFDRFFRGDLAASGHVPGTGLGLSITKAIVEAHGGRIAVESVPDGGSTFIVWLRSSPDPTQT
jgi:PAS domain S-box-containing protein